MRLQERLQQRPRVQVVPLGRQDAALDERRGELHCAKFNAREFEIQYAGDAGAQHQHIRRDEIVVKQLEVLQLPIDVRMRACTWTKRSPSAATRAGPA